MRSNSLLVALITFVLAGAGAGFGFLAGSIIVGLLMAAAFIVVWIGCGAVEIRAYGRAWLAVVTGVVAIGAAMTIGDMGGRWFWLPALLLVGLAITAAGSSAWNDSRRNGEALVALGILVMVFAVLAPIVVYPALAEPGATSGEATPGFSAADGLEAVGGALGEAATSVWGWIDLAALVLVGLASWRRGGAALAPVLAAAAVFVVGGFSADAGEAIAEAAAESPAWWLERLAVATDEHWGSAGWGVLALSVGAVAAALPVLRKMVVMSQVAAAARRAGGDDEAIARFMAAEGYGAGWSSLIVLGYEILTVGTAAMLWIGLRSAASEVGALPFDLIGIPDLAVPSFRPVWELSYFALAVVLGASAVLSGRLIARLPGAKRLPVFTHPVWQIGVAVLGAFVAPAGVLLFALGVAWVQTAAVLALGWRARLLHDDVYPVGAAPRPVAAGVDVAEPVRAPGNAAGGREAVGSGFDDRPVWERDGAEDRPIWADAGGADAGGSGGTPAGGAPPVGPPGPSPSAVTALFDAGPLLDIAAIGDDEYVVLSLTGELAPYARGVAGRGKRLQVVRPLGLGPAAARHVAFVDGGGRILELSFEGAGSAGRAADDPAPVVHSGVIGPADCFAVSPLGTVVVTGSGGAPQVNGFFLASEIGRSLYEGVEPPTALAFSPDGRVVAVGATSGDVNVVDVGGQGLISVLDGGQAGGRTVVRVAGASGDGWLVACDDERVAVWRGPRMLRSVDAGGTITALAVDSVGGRVASGTAFGLVRIFDADLQTRLVDERPFAAEVRRILWVDGGAAVVCAGAAGAVCRIGLG